jgi:succinate dehydrogenase / fumarate reductase, flavoprotein subunit
MVVSGFRKRKATIGDRIRNDNDFCNVTTWQYTGTDSEPIPNIEPLVFENVKLAQRSYK